MADFTHKATTNKCLAIVNKIFIISNSTTMTMEYDRVNLYLLCPHQLAQNIFNSLPSV